VVEYRNQHYVPEFLLEGWATDGDVVTLHFDSGHEEASQSISRICSRNYLYTPPNDTALEKELANLEGRQSDPIKAFRKGITPVKLSALDKLALCSFILTQRLRTRVYRQELLNESYQIYNDPLQRQLQHLTDQNQPLPLDEEVSNSIRDTKIKENAKQLQNYLMIHGFFGIILRDLDMVLAVNETDNDFICGDSPVVFDNIRFKHEQEQYYPGAANQGLLAYCPISPEEYIILYDPVTYIFEHDTEKCFSITDPDVAQILNQFQLMNAGDIAVYDSSGRGDELLKLYEQAQEIRRYEKIPRRIETTFETIDYEAPPQQPLPNTGNPFEQLHVNTGVSYEENRTPELSEFSENIVRELFEQSQDTPEAAIRAIRIALSQFRS
jgi:hypothetical protein